MSFLTCDDFQVSLLSDNELGIFGTDDSAYSVLNRTDMNCSVALRNCVSAQCNCGVPQSPLLGPVFLFISLFFL